VTANVVWYAVKRCAGQAGINNLAPACAMVVEANWSRFSFSLVTHLCKQPNGTSEANKNSRTR
jgi:hypothetical protein